MSVYTIYTYSWPCMVLLSNDPLQCEFHPNLGIWYLCANQLGSVVHHRTPGVQPIHLQLTQNHTLWKRSHWKQYIYLWICDDVRVNVTGQFCLLKDTLLTCSSHHRHCIMNRGVKHRYTFCAELANCGLKLNVLLHCETWESGQQAYVTAAHDLYWFVACWLHSLHWQICWRSAVFCRPVWIFLECTRTHTLQLPRSLVQMSLELSGISYHSGEMGDMSRRYVLSHIECPRVECEV